jgi:hypothetical protein
MNKQIMLILVGLLCLTSIAYAQVSTNYDLSWHVLSGSGGQMDSASYIQKSTAGQVIGSSESSNYRMGAGYWYGAVSADTPPTTGAINIASSPSGAAIELDGASTSYTTNVMIPDVSPGTHTIKLTLDGYQDWSTNLSVTAGETSYVHATLMSTSQIKFDTRFRNISQHLRHVQRYIHANTNDYGKQTVHVSMCRLWRAFGTSIILERV